MLDPLPSQRGGQPAGVALDDDVEVGPLRAEQQVAHGAADQVDVPVARGGAQLGHARQRFQARGE